VTTHALEHREVGGPLMTPAYRWLLLVVLLGALTLAWRFVNGIGSVAALNNGYPWGVWIAIDVVVGTALGCGGYAVALLVYILNKGRYHPLVRPAILTSMLGYGLAVIAVACDLGRFWDLWKVPIFFWRWSHSPQLEVAICVMLYNFVLVAELAPAFLEKWVKSPNAGLAAFSRNTLKVLESGAVWILALGMLLPTMHQSSLGTMMLLPGPRMHPLWFTPWLPFLFLVNCLMLGYAIVVIESVFSARAFRVHHDDDMVAAIGRVAMGVSLFWVAFRIGDAAIAGKLPLAFSGRGWFFVAEIVVQLAGALMLATDAMRRSPMWQVRSALLLIAGGALFRVNTYLIAFQPGAQWSYFPAIPELLITFGIIALEVALYIAAVKRFPILSGVTETSSRSHA
jgi:Ni/Fe-hydrogenase subunit HybB-like protein